MALFNECMPQCAQKVFDTADIVRDRDFSPTIKDRIVDTSHKPVSGQHVGLATIHLLPTEGLRTRFFCTSIPLVRVSAKLLKILIAALSPSVAY
jgi:hypothetical protein